MFLRRALGLFARLRPAAPLRGPARFIHGLNCRDSTWRKQHVNLMLMLSGPTTIFFGLCKNSVFAGDSSMADNVESEGYLTGLRRIEDGSVISNTHTSKWRIFTDNGRELFLKGKLDEAEKYFQLALYEAKEGFGLRDPHVASSCNNLAELYRVRKEFEKAEPLYLEAINILEESFGLDDIRVAAALHNLGQCYLAQRKLEQARACYERALKIKGRVLGYGHPDYADTMYHLGTVLHLQGKEKDAEALIQESIKILEEGGQGETMMCIRRMKYLSQMLLKSNQVAEAENLQRKILHILEISKGWNSMDTVVAAEDLALTLQALGCLEEAHELLERCLDVRKKLLPEDHIQIAANSLHLARVVILNSSHQRKMKISEASAELDKAKHFLDNSIRIAKQVLDRLRKNQISLQNTHMPAESGEDVRAALLILLQSLDSVGLLEAARLELQGSKETHTFPSEAELALRECISIVKECGLLSCLLNSPDIKVEYLSCLKHLMNLLSEYVDGKTQKSRELQELKDEVQRIEAEFFSSRHK